MSTATRNISVLFVILAYALLTGATTPDACSFPENACCPPVIDCPVFECKSDDCAGECSTTGCGSASLFSCKSYSKTCQFDASGNTFFNSVFDGTTSESFTIDTNNETSFKRSVAFMKPSDEGECDFQCLEGCQQFVGLCDRPKSTIVCNFDGMDGCQGAYFENPGAEVNEISHSGTALFALPNSNLNDVNAQDSINAGLYLMHSKNQIKSTTTRMVHTLIDARYSINNFNFQFEYLYMDASYSKNTVVCGPQCALGFFDFRHSEENVFRCTSESCITIVVFMSFGIHNMPMCGQNACRGCTFDMSHSKNNEVTCDGTTACVASTFDVSHSMNNDITCNGVRSCVSCIFLMSYGINNEISCFSDGCEGAIIYTPFSKNVWDCLGDRSCQQAQIIAPNSENTWNCMGGDACSSTTLASDESHNTIECKEGSCVDMYFQGKKSRNYVECTDTSCLDAVKLVLSYSEINRINCQHSSCNQTTNAGPLFILDYSYNEIECSSGSCTNVVMDISYSETKLICGEGSCKENVWFAKHSDVTVEIKGSGKTLIGTTLVCYDSKCELQMEANSVFGIQITCGGERSDCSVASGDSNRFAYHCYNGAKCSLHCEKNCGDNSVDSFLNCETAAFCDISCGGGDCKYLEIAISNNPFRIRSKRDLDNDCDVSRDDGSMSCSKFAGACIDPNFFICNPGAIFENVPIICRASPYECPDSICFLSSLSIAYYQINFHPYQHDYVLFVELYEDFLDIFAETVDPRSLITAGEFQNNGAIMAKIPLSYGEYTNIEISVCSVSLTTCFYNLKVVRGIPKPPQAIQNEYIQYKNDQQHQHQNYHSEQYQNPEHYKLSQRYNTHYQNHQSTSYQPHHQSTSYQPHHQSTSYQPHHQYPVTHYYENPQQF